MGVQRCHISVGRGRNEPIDKDQVLFWKRKLSADFEIHFKKNENPSVGKSPTMPDLRLVGSSSPFTVEETIQSETIQFYSEKENSERTADLEISRWKPNEKSVSIGDGPTLPDLRLVYSSSPFTVEETIQSETIQFFYDNQNSDQLILKCIVENRTRSPSVLVMVQRCQISVWWTPVLSSLSKKRYNRKRSNSILKTKTQISWSWNSPSKTERAVG